MNISDRQLKFEEQNHRPRGPLQWQQVLAWLQQDGKITAEEAEQTMDRCSQAHSALSAVERLATVAMTTVDGSLLTADELMQFVAEQVGLEFMKIDPLRVNVARVAESMSVAYAERHHILPVQVNDEELVVATSEPFMDDWVSDIERQSKRRVRRVLCNAEDIQRYTGEFFSLARSVHAVQKRGGASNTNSFEQLVELGRGNRTLDANDQSVIRVVDWLWQYAFEQRASDIHLEPKRDQAIIRFRIDGVLHTVYQVPSAVVTAMTARIKLLGRMNVVERRRPQDGRIKTRSPAGQEVEMRLSTLPTAFGEKLVMRIFDPLTAVQGLSDLGFTGSDAERWQSMIHQPNGIILVTGPTGSGKTTTLYSTLRSVATEAVNVSTIEDPIERIEPALNQTQVQPQLNFSFAEGIRTLMRQDPDIIMVGEIRDLETAEMAVQAALTGHLVFATLHTNDAPSAFTRLMELGVPAYLLSATILGVMAQRLVRTLCRQCREPDDSSTPAHLEEAVRPWHIRQGEYRPFRPVGCELCRMSGFRGRLGIYEILQVSETLRTQVHEQADLLTLRRQAIRDGMRPLRLAGAMRVAEGLTTLQEVIAVTPPLNG